MATDSPAANGKTERTPDGCSHPGSSTSGGGEYARGRAGNVPPELERRLTQTRDRITQELQARDALILKALAAGGTLREVGEMAGLSHTGVAQVLRRKGVAN